MLLRHGSRQMNASAAIAATTRWYTAPTVIRRPFNNATGCAQNGSRNIINARGASWQIV